MKSNFALILLTLIAATQLFAQDASDTKKHIEAIRNLIDMYARSRETKDTVLLKNILTADIDQLVSTGEWRKGIRVAIEGMMRSSTGNPGSRKFIIESIRFLDAENAIVDARYEIQNPDGAQRKMWSTFIVTYPEGNWKISAIRNMLPTN